MKIIEKLKNLTRKIASYFVTWYYDRCYRKAVEEADRRHETEGGMMYVVDHLVKGRTLTVVNRKGFRKMKHDMQGLAFRSKLPEWEMYWSPAYGTEILREGAWYHTADGSGNGALSPVEKEARRLYFIRVGLYRAKLIDSLNDK